jgi:hypothetical protein
MNDWMQDYLIVYEQDGERRSMIWPGFTYQGAQEEFQRRFPERRVVTVDLEEGD